MSKDLMPDKGGSWLRQKDGALVREGWTRGSDEPAPEAPAPAPAEPPKRQNKKD